MDINPHLNALLKASPLIVFTLIAIYTIMTREPFFRDTPHKEDKNII